MNKVIRKIDFQYTLLGIIVVCSIYLTFGFSTIAYKGDIFKAAHIFMCAFSCLIYFLFDCIAYKNRNIYKQVNIFNAVMLMISTFYCIRGLWNVLCGIELCDYKLMSKVIFELAFIAIALIRKEEICVLVNKLWLGIYDNRKIIPIFVISAILMYEPYMSVYRYDGLLYYTTYSNVDMYSISSMGFYGHLSQGAAAVVGYMSYLFGGNTHYGIYLTNLISMFLGGIAFLGTLKTIVSGKKEYIYIMLTAMYLASPYILGLSNYASIDYYSITWFAIILLFAYKEWYFLYAIAGFFYAFTKEPALLIYGTLCASIFFIDLLKNRLDAIKRPRYYGMFMVAIIWCITAIINGIWSLPGSGVGYDENYIKRQLSTLYILNYSWLVICVFVVFGGYVIYKKIKQKASIDLLSKLIPVLCCTVVYTIFCCVYVTAINARYVDCIPCCLYLIVSVCILIASDEINEVIIASVSGCILICMLIATYSSCDFFSKKMMNTVDIGNQQLISTSANKDMLGDCNIYNKQMIWFEKVYSKAIGGALNKGYDIIISGNDMDAYSLDGITGQLENSNKGIWDLTEYYDIKKQKRSLENIENMDSIHVYAIKTVDEIYSLDKYSDSNRYVFLYTDINGYGLAKKIKKECNIVDEIEYMYRGWSLNGLVFSMD